MFSMLSSYVLYVTNIVERICSLCYVDREAAKMRERVRFRDVYGRIECVLYR